MEELLDILKGLKPGRYRILKPQEVKELKNMAIAKKNTQLTR